MKTGRFTMPGEAGHEALTLRLAERWGADVLRDSDGTALSDALLGFGGGIYSTLCLIRADNVFAKNNPAYRQQNFLMSDPQVAAGGPLMITPLVGFSRDQFEVNDTQEAIALWQVYDRTLGEAVADWTYNPQEETLCIPNTKPYHVYTVSFLAYRQWEEISMYNHITNGWGDRERLIAVDVRYPAVQKHLLSWLANWCKAHPQTTVVRFTSLFYNFAWFWGDTKERRFRYSDWASYDFTVSPAMLSAFVRATDIPLCAEDFVQAGRYGSAHNPPTVSMRAYLDFVQGFVADFARQCVDIIHDAGKQAFLFYDDSWIGAEPQGPHFAKMGFDGLIKCVFSAFEARLCAAVPGVTHEIRLHPYLFPTGLSGEPTFAPGGNPAADARRYWLSVRRALMRVQVERIGLGGYPHLCEPFPDFIDEIAEIADTFRALATLHEAGKPTTFSGRVGILTAWGRLRAWSTSGHLHEHPDCSLTHVLESLAGLPFEVDFLDFDDLVNPDCITQYDVILNAGAMGSAWSGGDAWANPVCQTALRAFVARGGGLVGIQDPTAHTAGGATYQLCHALGVDRDLGDRSCNTRTTLPITKHWITQDAAPDWPAMSGAFAMDEQTVILSLAKDGTPLLAIKAFGVGRGVYLSNYRHTPKNTRILARAIAYAGRMEKEWDDLMASDPAVEVARFSSATVVVNGSCQSVRCPVPGVGVMELLPNQMEIVHANATVLFPST